MANKTLHGKWLTPLPVTWVDDDERNANTPEGVRCFITARGHMRMRVEKVPRGQHVDRLVTLEENETGFIIKGKANVRYDRIHFKNGAMWIRENSNDRQAQQRDSAPLQDDGVHYAVEDAVEPSGCFGCFSQKKNDQGGETVPAVAEPEPPQLPPAKDMEAGFFAEDQLEDIVDRINDVVGIWGVSEAAEREFIKPPVVRMNKMIKAAMSTFLDNPLIDLFQYLMDESLELLQKAKALGHYMQDRFVRPLTEALMNALAEEFKAVEWIRDHVSKVVHMMSQMVTDQLMSRSVEQINDASVCTLDREGADDVVGVS